MEENKTKRYHRSYTGALILIILGAVFLLNNFGILSWGVWDTLWRFWPVLLVIWGLQLLFGAWWLGELITGIITLVILITVLLISVASTNTQLDNYMKDHFRWWKQRLKAIGNFYHIYRIDHVVGFFRIWGIPHEKKRPKAPFIPLMKESVLLVHLSLQSIQA